MTTFERDYELHDGLMPWIGSWIDVGGLEHDVRFQELLSCMNLAHLRAPVEANNL